MRHTCRGSGGRANCKACSELAYEPDWYAVLRENWRRRASEYEAIIDFTAPEGSDRIVIDLSGATEAIESTG